MRFHYALTAAALGDFSPERQQASYELVRSLITLAGGLFWSFLEKPGQENCQEIEPPKP